MGGFAEAVERPCFAIPVADLAADGQFLLVVFGGLGRLAETGVEEAEAVQRDGFPGAVAELLQQGQGLLNVVASRSGG